MHKLKIGIPINADYNPNAGGGYSYITQLIEAIDNHHFNDEIAIVFINYEGKQLATKHQMLSFHPFQKRSSADIFRKAKILLLKKSGIFKTWLNKLELQHAEARNANIVKTLEANEIKVLLYTSPERHAFNFPFITIHWDIGHLSTYMFPEFVADFKNRCGYYQDILPKALFILTETEAGKQELANYTTINPARIEVMPIFPGKVITEQVEQQAQETILQNFGLNNKKFFIYPAQFWAHKNHTLLIDAFETLLTVHPDTLLAFTGSDKGNLKYIKNYIQSRHLEERVKNLGFISNTELYTLYKNAVALVMPTFLGPSNMPPLEAANLNCQVLVSDLPGHRELLGSYATYFDPLDHKSLSKLMISALEPTTDQASFSNPNAFTIKNAIQKLEQVLLKTASIRKNWL
ncbi:hypothetical protein DBR40_17085 [Pedobacter sp. KBW01]|uniref:glycosyltransferase n=1 Tax=Pedobacter sp. KBW01 TaxID=2153364 RepID=UPI000F5B3268|nr:glycosyltransferase [Pedobacter sp. KBW01]RQO71513.1 hypothetical protein DBR40_17085 [Pedobacter sp. KBW01]